MAFGRRSDSLLQLLKLLIQASELRKAPHHFIADLRARNFDQLLERSFRGAGRVVSGKSTAPHQRRTGKRLLDPELTAIHSLRQIDLALAVKESYTPHFAQVYTY